MPDPEHDVQQFPTTDVRIGRVGLHEFLDVERRSPGSTFGPVHVYLAGRELADQQAQHNVGRGQRVLRTGELNLTAAACGLYAVQAHAQRQALAAQGVDSPRIELALRSAAPRDGRLGSKDELAPAAEGLRSLLLNHQHADAEAEAVGDLVAPVRDGRDVVTRIAERATARYEPWDVLTPDSHERFLRAVATRLATRFDQPNREPLVLPRVRAAWATRDMDTEARIWVGLAQEKRAIPAELAAAHRSFADAVDVLPDEPQARLVAWQRAGDALTATVTRSTERATVLEQAQREHGGKAFGRLSRRYTSMARTLRTDQHQPASITDPARLAFLQLPEELQAAAEQARDRGRRVELRSEPASESTPLAISRDPIAFRRDVAPSPAEAGSVVELARAEAARLQGQAARRVDVMAFAGEQTPWPAELPAGVSRLVSEATDARREGHDTRRAALAGERGIAPPAGSTRAHSGPAATGKVLREPRHWSPSRRVVPGGCRDR